MSTTLGVIFDMDGVLVDSYRAHLRSWQEIAREVGLEMSEADFARTFGRTSRDIIRTLWPQHFDRDEQQVAQFDAAKELRYREILEAEFPEMPGAAELIEALHGSGFRLAIGSSGPPPNVALVKRRLRCGSRFEATVDGTEVSRGKPHPDVFLTAATKLGLEPSRCAVIEDAPAGVEAARRAAMAAIGLLGTAPRDELERQADLVVPSLRELTPERIARLILEQ